MLFDRFGVTLELQATENASAGRNTTGGYGFDWTSFVPGATSDTIDWTESDWFGAWLDSFTETTIQHTTAPGTLDQDWNPSGGEPYDVEGMYFDNDADNYYIAIVSSVPHFSTDGSSSDVGVIDPRDGSYQSAVRSGDLAISFFDGTPRDEAGASEWHYNYGIDVTLENRDVYTTFAGIAVPTMRSNAVGTGLWATTADAGGAQVNGPSVAGDWYTSAAPPTGGSGVSAATESSWEHTNFDSLSSAFTGTFLGDVTVNYYEYSFAGGLLENDYPTYIYEYTIPRSLFGANDKTHGETISFRFTPGCRNDGNGTGDGSVSLAAMVDDLEVGDLVFEDTNGNGIFEPGQGETGVNDVTVQLFASGTPTSGTPVATTTTANLNGNDGRYVFSALAAGDYYIHIPSSEFQSGEDLYGRLSSGVTELDPDDDENEDGTGTNGSGSSGAGVESGPGDENGIDNAAPQTNGISSGVFTLAPSTEPTGEDSAGVQVTEIDGNSNLTVDFGFVCRTVVVSPSTLSNGVVGTVYSQQMTAAGGTGAYTYTVTGTLPDGLSLVGDTISGTPTSETSRTFTITATDASGCLGTREYTVQPVCPAISLSSTPAILPTGTIGDAYSATISASGGTASYSFVIKSGSALPAGLSLSTSGTISGAPSGPAVSTQFTVVATDQFGCTGEAVFTIGVDCNVLGITPSTLADGSVGVAYGPVNFSASGASGTVTWGLTGTLPDGLTFSGGTLSGTPTEGGSFSFSVLGTDTNSCQGSVGLVLDIPIASISGTVFEDTDDDGDGDVVINVVTLTLCDSGGSPVDNPNLAGSQDYVITTTDGTYSFVNLSPASYIVKQSQPSGYLTVTDLDSNSDLLASPADPANSSTTDNQIPVNLLDGETDSGNDFVEIVPLSIGNLVFCDENNNGVKDGSESGINGVAVELFYDSTDDGDFDDLGEDVAVASLVTANDGSIDGAYLFENLYSGNYRIAVSAANFGLGALIDKRLSSTTTDTNDNGEDNDDNGIQDGGSGTVTYSPLIALALGGEPGSGGSTNTDDTVDFGFFDPTTLVAIGNLVFEDSNGDGDFDSGTESPIADVTVELFNDGDDPFTATPVLSVTTDANGCYIFDNLTPGTYFVHVPASEFQTGGDLAGYTSSVGGGSDESSDDDSDENGIDAAYPMLHGVSSTDYDLQAGSESTSETAASKACYSGVLPDDNVNLTADLGFEIPYDYGDLPEGGNKDYPTEGSASGDRPRHALGSGLLLGVSVDAETGGQSSPSANGDGLDEDGVSIPKLIPGRTAQIDYTVTIPGSVTDPVLLNAFIDFNCDGDFADSGEQIATDVVAANGANTLAVVVPSGAVPGTTYARFRISTEAGLGATGDAVDGEVEDYRVTIVSVPGAIGNYVWIDEDSNGLQDAGEPGIPNVRVVLKDGAGTEIASTVTDTQGGYLFPDLDAGSYFVDVDESSLSSSLTQTTDFTNGSGDFGNKDHASDGYAITLGVGEVNLTVDFGYNYNPTADVNAPVGSPTAALGDRVWLDLDGDGFQDPGEPGVANAQVSLLDDADGDLVYSLATGPVLTDENGYYLFDGLAPGAYMVFVSTAGSSAAGYTQTGDPDHFNTSGASNDNLTTTPVILAPGDVFLNADFGYQPTANTLGEIGDRIWLDEPLLGESTQGDKTLPPTEAGIEGVTVALIADTDKDGQWDAGEMVIATDVTDDSGCYIFQGLPVDVDGEGYLVWVNDTDGVLVGLSQTYDLDGELDRLSASEIDNASNRIDHTQDFSFTLTPPSGSIGDTVWGDLDNSGGDQGTQGQEPGLPGVTVTLSEGGTVIATTLTDSDGGYLFTGLAFGSYRVTVDTSTLPAGYSITPSYDPDGGTNSYSDRTITPTAQHARDQDFSYPPNGTGTILNSIGDKIWADNGSADASQATDGTEPGISGVLVTLLDSAGTTVLASTFTDAQGNYLFTDLADGTYTVRVTSPAGYVATPAYDPFGANDGVSVIAVAGGQHDRVQDFSFTAANPLGSIGDTVWFDVDNSGGDQTTQDSENGIAGVVVYLEDSSGVELASAVTDSSGNYLFEALPYGDYVVTVDTATLPEGVLRINTYDSDGGGDSSSAVTIDAVTPNNTVQDFSYPPCGEIGDTVFFDLDGDGTPDFGEGLANIEVQLLSGATVISRAYTDRQGRYLFDCVEAGTYTVKVVTATLPSTQLVNTTDPNGPSLGDSESSVTIGVGDSDLDQDFGYRATGGSIGNLVWEDRDADGSLDGSETGLDGVTVDLYYDANQNCLLDSGDEMLGRTITSGGGAYLFENLPVDDGSGEMAYLVDVSDREGVLQGHWHSLGAQLETSDDESKADPFCVTLSTANADVLTSDFGYYVDGACLGNYVWQDLNDNGLQDDGIASGIDDALVTLTISYPDGTETILPIRTTSLPNPGAYQFCNLLLDEDYRQGSAVLNTPAAGQPAYDIKVDTLDRFPGKVSASGTTALSDSDLHTGVASLPIQGSIDASQNADPSTESNPIATYDFGFASKPDSFAEFQSGYATVLGLDDNEIPGVPGGSQNTANDQGAASDNPDNDTWDNLLEYALCLHPGSGVPGHGGFCVEYNALDDELDITFLRPAGGVSDVTYTILGRSSLPVVGDSTWTPLATVPGQGAGASGASITDQGDGSEKVQLSDVGAISPLTSTLGFVRLSVSDSSNTSVTMVQGWMETEHGIDQCATYSCPLLKKQSLSGGVDSVASNVLTLTNSVGTADLSATLDLTNKSYYLEVIEGDNVGHRFDITGAGQGTLTVSSDADLCAGPPFNTLADAPANLAGDRFIVREHYLIEELFPPTLPFVAGSNADVADRLLFYSDRWDIYYLDSVPDPDGWQLDGEAFMDYGKTVVPPSQGMFLHPRTTAVTMLAIGEVRENDFVLPLNSGYTLMPSPFPIEQSATERLLVTDYGNTSLIGGFNPSDTDQLSVWDGDTSGVYKESYTAYFHLQGAAGAGFADGWREMSDAFLMDHSATKIFQRDRSAFLLRRSNLCDPAYRIPATWTP